MKCNLPMSFNKHPKSERDAIEEYFNEQLNHLILECYAEELYSKNYRKQREGEWYVDDLTGIIKCNLCDNDAPISTVSGEQYKARFCQHCGAKMKGGAE